MSEVIHLIAEAFEKATALAAQFGVQSIPHPVVLKGGQVQQRMAGLQQSQTLMAVLRKAGA